MAMLRASAGKIVLSTSSSTSIRERGCSLGVHQQVPMTQAMELRFPTGQGTHESRSEHPKPFVPASSLLAFGLRFS
jgi:hypothetical protein